MKFILFVAGVLLTFQATAQAQTTAFTYQGQLEDTNGPVTGDYDLRFALYDAGTNGNQLGGPLTNSPVALTNGLFTVLLDFGADIFTGPDRWLEIGVRTNGSAGGYTTMGQRQQLTPTPYAIYSTKAGTAATANNVAPSSVTTTGIADGAITGAKIAPSQVVKSLNGLSDAVTLSAGANITLTPSGNNIQISSAGTGGGGSLPSGISAFSTNKHDDNLLTAGFSKAGKTSVGEAWVQGSVSNGPPGAAFPSTLWTGSELIIWGGDISTCGRYNPSADRWTAITTNGAPASLGGSQAVWSGTQMVVWGGTTATNSARYNPNTDSWAPVSTSGEPSNRTNSVAIWTGTEMLVWGGDGMTDGARYNPATDTWSSIAASPFSRSIPTSSFVWTGTELIVWGGLEAGIPVNNGMKYKPSTDGWSLVSTTGAPAARYYHAAVWIGSEMIVFGGVGSTAILGDGGRYNPTMDLWGILYTNNAPTPRILPSAVWTGTGVIFWGGYLTDGYNDTYLNNGARYDPATFSWAALQTTDAPVGRIAGGAAWTGSQMLVFGGLNQDGVLADLAAYFPARTYYLYLKQ